MADQLLKIPKDLFKNVKFYLAEEGNDKVKDILKQGGATREFFFSNLATHVVSSTTNFPEYEQAKEAGIPMVKPEWVIYSVKCEVMMPTAAFSLEKKLFSGVVACPSQMLPDDRDALWAMITFYGGRCHTTFDSNCTHLLVPKPEGEKYEVALQHKEKVKIVIPEWILDCIKAKALLDESKYTPVNDPETQSQSILTPDNHGETTGAVVNAGIERVTETPSSLLSPESPAVSKLKKLSADNKESENSSEESTNEKLDEGNTNETTKDGIRRRRSAAESADQALQTLGVVEALAENDDIEESIKSTCQAVSNTEDLGKSNGGRDGKEEMEVQENGSENDSNKEIVVSKLLSGCVFVISDYQETVQPGTINTWKKVIRQNAGVVEDVYSTKVTHVLCSHQHGEYYRYALADGKRLITCHWLNDVILNMKLFAPQSALHLPVPFKGRGRCRRMIISVTGFEGKERQILKNMIYIIGAKYTGYLSRSVTHLICRNETSEKYKKAREWDIICTNARWISDIMTGGCDYPVNMKRYKTFGSDNELDINMILAKELLEAWKGFEPKEDIMDKKRKLEMLEREMKEDEANKRPRLEEPARTDSNKEIAVSTLFSGCVFFISDYQDTVEPAVINGWKKDIRQNAGVVEDVYSAKVTHVLCSHQDGDYYKTALKEGKRLVTCHWLLDVIFDQKLIAPRTPLHLPVPLKDRQFCDGMVISVADFEGEEKEMLKIMIRIIRAKYNDSLERSVTHLICRNETSEKYKKAREWNITCRSPRWIGDIMTGGRRYPVDLNRYTICGSGNEFDINMSLAKDLLEAWKGFEPKEDIMDKMKEDGANKRPRLEEPARTPEPQATAPTVPNVGNPVTPRVIFTGLNPGAVRRLTEKLSALGGETATSIRTCTHIVASKIMRTIKFLTGISVCRYIVSPLWIDKSHEVGKYLNEKDYVLHDEDGEKLYGMSLPQSIDSAQAKPLFQGITIYVTANVRPDQKSMAEILDCAGGKLMAELPPKSSLKSLAEQKTEDGQPAFVCVTCEEDTHLCKDMKTEGIGVHNVEFVLSGILKQQLDFYRYKF